MAFSRRDAVKVALFGAAASPFIPGAATAASVMCPARPTAFGHGIEGQRKADLGNGTYLNPIVSGDHPDPTILKDGRDYYMTFSSFLTYPGAVIWHSTDLVNWAPVGPALKKPVGSVWAMDLVKHNGRYFIYIPAMGDDGSQIYVIHADTIRGPWSDPINLHVPGGCIDPGHAVGEDGKRYLFFNGVRRIRLSDDGLSTVGKLEHVYDPWHYPKDWVVEMFSPEGPKVFRRGEYFYLLVAVGGTAGPATSHMVTVARSQSINGPWENCPFNPVVHTKSKDEPWWSRGHASMVTAPDGASWLVYHGYEKGLHTLGRQVLLEPVKWRDDGWFETLGGILDHPLPKPKSGKTSKAGFALSDDFSTNKMGLEWGFFSPGPDEMKRARYADHSLIIQGKGTTLADSSPLVCIAGDRSYEFSATLEMTGAAQGGLALFYSDRSYVGLGFTNETMFSYQYGQETAWFRQKMPRGPVRVKIRNQENVTTFFYAHPGGDWIQHPIQMEVSGYNHNVFGGFLSLRPAVFSAGKGRVRVRDFKYRGLNI